MSVVSIGISRKGTYPVDFRRYVKTIQGRRQSCSLDFYERFFLRPDRKKRLPSTLPWDISQLRNLVSREILGRQRHGIPWELRGFKIDTYFKSPCYGDKKKLTGVRNVEE